jgi:type I restriction enzyme S subunit
LAKKEHHKSKKELPSSWVSIPLREIVLLSIGGDWGVEPNKKIEGYVATKVIRGTDYKNWYSLKTKNAAIRLIKESSLLKRKLELGDLVVEISGGGPDQPVGRTIVIDSDALSDEFPLICSNFFRRIHLSSKVSPYYVNYFLLYAYLNGELNKFQTNTINLRNLKFELFLNYQIPLPPRRIQEDIVQRLDDLMSKVHTSKLTIDGIIPALSLTKNQVLNSAIKGELTKSWRRESRMNDNWELVTLNDLLLKIESGKSVKCEERPPKRNEIGIIKVSAVTWGMFQENESKTIINNNHYQKRYVIKEGDFLFSRANTTELVGACVIVGTLKKKLMLSDKILRFLLDETKVEPKWLIYFLRSSEGRSQIESLASGNQQSMKNISQDKIRSIKIELPTIEEQRQVISVIEERLEALNMVTQRQKDLAKKLSELPLNILESTFRIEKGSKSSEFSPNWLEEIEEERGNYISQIKTNTMKKVKEVKSKKESLIELIAKSFPSKKFTFSDLEKISRSDYDNLKDQLFQLIDKGVTMEFDKENETIFFKYIKK